MGGRWSTAAGTLRRIVRETLREIHDENITFMAGSIAYHAFVSLIPLVLLGALVLAALDQAAFTASLVETTEPFLTPYARDLLVESLDVPATRTGVSVVGAVTLLWGMSKIFRGLDVAFSEIYGTRSNKRLLEQFENGIVVFAALGVAVAVFLVAGAVAAAVPAPPYRAALNPLFLVAGLAVAFLPVYYVFPDEDVTVREVVPGTLFAAVGWAALEALFQGYVGLAGRYEAAYGALGSAFLLLIWLYFGGLLLLVGAVLNAVLAGRTGDEHALGVTDEVSADPPDLDRPAPSVGRVRSARDRVGTGRADADGGRVGEGAGGRPTDAGAGRRAGADLRRADRSLDADPEALRERVATLETETARLEREARRLERENDRLRRRNEALALRLRRQRRSVWARTKRWLLGDRE
ncbi:YihY/virulence factor BrkB family protein [Halorussus sp. AFM4]|uniref:YihY/virulence factor BrkB family protein n=1 Tax=Halorussus sp. AFM4 TaxID=3421651 RepID=UPI003EBECCF5